MQEEIFLLDSKKTIGKKKHINVLRIPAKVGMLFYCQCLCSKGSLYVGVIIGDDLRDENGNVITDHTKRAKTDSSLKGIKKMMKENPG